MKKWISLALLILAIAPCWSQTRQQLEQRRRSLLNQIEENRQLLSESEQESTATLSSIEGIQARIDLQEEVIQTITSEIDVLSRNISRSESNVARLGKSVEDLEAQHVKHLKQAYIDRRMENTFVFLLSASSLNEAFIRWRYLEAVNRVRQNTYDKYVAQKDSIQTGLQRLRQQRADKQGLAEDAIDQERQLSQTRKEAQSVLAGLRKNESQIRKELDQQMRESERLAREIERLIAEAVDNSAAEAALPNAPALAALTSDFAGNKGKLPWPVDRGMVTGKFGDQPHPVIKSIKITNNGIDITAPKGESVRAVFEGEVVGKKIIPGFDFMVIVRHGAYYSVYSRLVEANVEMGDKVRTGQVIGKLKLRGGCQSEIAP